MGMMRSGAIGLALTATLAGAMPAEARGPHHRRHGYERVKTGDVLLGAALLGGLLAITAAKKPKPAPFGVAFEPVSPGDDGAASPAATGGSPAEAAAVDACMAAVGEQFEDDEDRLGRVEEIGAVEPTAKGYRVRGQVRIEQADGSSQLSRFRCSVNGTGERRTLVIG